MRHRLGPSRDGHPLPVLLVGGDARMSGSSENETAQSRETTYQTSFQCDVCLEYFGVEFNDPSETFEATCPHCNTYYPELYV